MANVEVDLGSATSLLARKGERIALLDATDSRPEPDPTQLLTSNG